MTDSLKDRVLAALRTVEDPEMHVDLVTAGMVKGVETDGGHVSLHVELTTPACPLKDEIRSRVLTAVEPLEGVEAVDLDFTARVRAAAPPGPATVPGLRNVVAVASGKGGVGKSTAAVNLAVGLAMEGARVGLLDADIYGPSVPKLLGLPSRQPEARGQKMIPFTVETPGEPLKVMSMAFFLEGDQPVVWRGPMLHKALQQFLHDVEWGELDYLLIDLPPGTGDVQLSLSQIVPLTGAVVVTTPQEVALQDVRKAVAMFSKVNVPVLGVLENMSYFRCPGCGDEHAIFGRGGGEAYAEELDLPLLGAIPLDTSLREGGDAGTPAVARAEPGPAGEGLREAARRVAGQVSLVAARTSGSAFAAELPVLR